MLWFAALQVDSYLSRPSATAFVLMGTLAWLISVVSQLVSGPGLCLSAPSASIWHVRPLLKPLHDFRPPVQVP